MFWHLTRFQSNFRHSNLGKADQDLVVIMFIILYGLITENLRFKYAISFCKVIIKASYSDVITVLLFFVTLRNFSYLRHAQICATSICVRVLFYTADDILSFQAQLTKWWNIETINNGRLFFTLHICWKGRKGAPPK